MTSSFDVQRNSTYYEIYLDSPYNDAFNWNYTMYDGNGFKLNSSFCQANATSLSEGVLYAQSPFNTSKNYTKVAVFESGNYTTILSIGPVK